MADDSVFLSVSMYETSQTVSEELESELLNTMDLIDEILEVMKKIKNRTAFMGELDKNVKEMSNFMAANNLS